MKLYILNFALCMLFPIFLSAQSLYKAQMLMDKFNYSEAIIELKDAIKNDKMHNEAIPMLAECYRMQHDIANSRDIYAQAVELPDAKPEYFYYYAQALQGSGNYSKAREMFQKYADKNPSDLRGKLFVAHCDSVLGPWKKLVPEFEIKAASNVNTIGSDFGPAIYNGDLIYASDFSNNPADGKEYGWTGRGFLNIMKSSPVTAGDFWNQLSATNAFDAKFNQEYHDGPASFSADGNSIYFTRAFYGKAKREGIFKTNLLKIYYATKSNGAWGEIKPFFLNSTEYSVGHSTLSPDGKTLYFVSDMPGGIGGTDIWICTMENNTWSKPVNLGPVVNTSENEMFPSMRDDGVLFFASEGHAGYGALDIFKTSKINGNWSVPVNLKAPINSSYDDFAIAFAPGNKNGFFSSNRDGGIGSDDIYAFRKIELPILPTYISGLVKDKTNMQPMEGASVFLLNSKTGKVKILKTSADGMYKCLVENPANYSIKAMMPDYIADGIQFPLAALKPGTTIPAPRDLLLDKLIINKSFKVENIYYDFDKYNIRKEAKPALDKLVSVLKENSITVELGSHTDCRGTSEYNDKLSQNRAQAAVDYIVKNGIDKSRITAKGYGETQLTNACSDGVECSPEEHQANRRTEFKVTDLKQYAANQEQFDYSIYSEGNETDVKSLPQGFFNVCK